MEIYLVQNRKENCHHDHITLNLKGNGNIVFSTILSREPETKTRHTEKSFRNLIKSIGK